MDYLALLFGFKGRLSRRPFWIAYLLVGCAVIALLLIIGLTAKSTGNVAVNPETGKSEPTGIFLVAMTLVYLVHLWIGLALSTKRLHDRGHRGWWIGFQILAFFGSVAVFAFALSVTGELRTLYYGLSILLALLASGLAIWLFVEVGLLKGTTGPNVYGPDPLQMPETHL